MPHTEAPWHFVEQYYQDDIDEKHSLESTWYLAWLKQVQGERVLNIGCGPTFYDDILHFGSIPKEVVGMDINRNNIAFLQEATHPQLAKAKQFSREHGITTRLMVRDALAPVLEFEEYFDSIVALGVVGMFPARSLTTLLQLIYRYLKPGGVLIDVDWTEHYLPPEKYQERRRYHWYNEEESTSIEAVGHVLQQTGFTLEKHDTYIVPNKKEYLWGKIYGYIAKKKPAANSL